MTTLLVTLVFILVLFFCGIGPTLWLLPARDSPYRVLVMPVIGLCSHILFSILLAQFNLVGRTISIITLICFSLFAIAGLRKSPVTRAELRKAAVPLLISFVALCFVAWPLFRAGYENYWGFANPDQAYLIPAMEWVSSHPLSVPPQYARSGVFRGIAENTVLGIFYVISTISLLTGVSPGLLFNIAAATMVFLVPGAVYVFSEALGLSRWTALAAAVAIACSSLLALTFCLDSLAALSVVAVVPVGLALVIDFADRPQPARAIPWVIVCAGMYYNYLGIIGVLGLLIAAILARGLYRRAISVRQLILPVSATVGLILVAFPGFAYSILRYFVHHTLWPQWITDKNSAEILLFFDQSFTVQGVPFFWGLQIPGISPSPWLGRPETAAIILFTLGCLLSVLLLIGARRTVSELSSDYVWVLYATLLVIFGYSIKKVGYGVFKLIGWVHPIVVVGLTASIFGLSRVLRRKEHRVLSFVPFVFLAAYAILNLQLSSRISRSSLGLEDAPYHNAPSLSYKEVRELQQVGRTRGREGIVSILSDVVAMRWADSFLLQAKLVDFPSLDLFVKDSSPRVERKRPPGRYLLHWNSDGQDLTPVPRNCHVWGNKLFALSRMSDVRDGLFFGNGWYRVERKPSTTISWQRRYRWLRKRGELILWNPSSAPKRLRLTLVTGYGNKSTERHVRMFVNGEKIDEICFRGVARVITGPFTASQPWTQIELEVQENAAPLPRDWSLWAGWVPKDARHLNVAVSEVEVLDANDNVVGRSDANFTATASPSGVLVNGVYPDGWIGPDAFITLRSPVTGAGTVEISGTVPGIAAFHFPYTIQVTLNETHIGDASVPRPGKFHVELPVASSLKRGEAIRILLKPEATFVGATLGSNKDSRRLSLMLERVALSSGKVKPVAGKQLSTAN